MWHIAHTIFMGFVGSHNEQRSFSSTYLQLQYNGFSWSYELNFYAPCRCFSPFFFLITEGGWGFILTL